MGGKEERPYLMLQMWGTKMAPAEKTEQLNLRLTAGARRACEEAATAAHMTLLDWARAVLIVAANQGAFGPPEGRKENGPKGKRSAKATQRKGE